MNNIYFIYRQTEDDYHCLNTDDNMIWQFDYGFDHGHNLNATQVEKITERLVKLFKHDIEIKIYDTRDNKIKMIVKINGQENKDYFKLLASSRFDI